MEDFKTLVDAAHARGLHLIELANSLLVSLPGAPIIYYGDEIRMGDDIWQPDRNGVRTPVQWDDSQAARFSQSTQVFAPVIETAPESCRQVNVEAQKADPGSLWHTLRRKISLHNEHAAFRDGELIWFTSRTGFLPCLQGPTPADHPQPGLRTAISQAQNGCGPATVDRFINPTGIRCQQRHTQG